MFQNYFINKNYIKYKLFYFQQTVCAAFEQQLQKFRVVSPNQTASGEIQSDKVSRKSSRVDMEEKISISASTSPPPPACGQKVISCGSLTSISSHTSASSSTSDEQKKKSEQNRRNWVCFLTK